MTLELPSKSLFDSFREFAQTLSTGEDKTSENPNVETIIQGILSDPPVPDSLREKIEAIRLEENAI